MYQVTIARKGSAGGILAEAAGTGLDANDGGQRLGTQPPNWDWRIGDGVESRGCYA